MQKKEEFFNLPNLISLLRIVLIPFFYYYIKNFNLNVLIFLAILMGVSDFLDGFLARKLGKVSDVGKFLDPFCDKVALFFLIFLIFYYRNFPAWAFWYTIFREVTVALGGLLILNKRKIPITPNFWGKANVTAEFFIFIVYLFGIDFLKKDGLIALFVYLTISLLIYLKLFYEIIFQKREVSEIVKNYSSYGFVRGNKFMNFTAILITFYFIFKLVYLLWINLKI